MSRPTDDPAFATGTNYGAGPYTGSPNKARPPAGNITEGLDPGAGVPAEWMNYLWNLHGEWIKYLGVGAPIAWCAVNTSGVALYGTGFNIASVVKNATGHYTINLTQGGSSATNMACLISGISVGMFAAGAGSTTAIDIHTYDTTGVASDVDFSLVVYST